MTKKSKGRPNKRNSKTPEEKVSGARVNLVMTPHRKDCYEAACRVEALKLSPWIRKHLDDVARWNGYDPDGEKGGK